MRAVALAVLLLALGAAGDGRAGRTAVPLAPCIVADAVSARCGTARVPEDRADPGSRQIGLRVVVIPARRPEPLPDPMLYVTGGPGGASTDDAAFVLSALYDLNARRDIVLVDQRGTGRSNRLDCRVPEPRPVSELLALATKAARDCLRALAVDPALYTTAPAADDLADVVTALGYPAVNVVGVSYGATVAQYLLALHPQLVRTAVLDGATLLDVPIFELWGRNGEASLRRILDRCARSGRCGRAYPRVRKEWFEVMATLRRAAVRSGDTTIDAVSAAGAMQAMTRSPRDAAQIPFVAHAARSGNWVPLAIEVERNGSGLFLSPRLMFWAIVCSEPWARYDPARAAAASRGTYLAELVSANAKLAQGVCSTMPKAGQPLWSRSRVATDVPVLFVVGADDPQDPPGNVAGAARTMTRSRTIVVPAGGHVSMPLGCTPQLVARFVSEGSGAPLPDGCLARITPPPFTLPPR